MKPSSLLFPVFRFLVFPAVIFTVWLYYYPAFFNCNFPLPYKPEATCLLRPNASATTNTGPIERAPFRLLALGDPQLEGDSSLPNPNDPWFPNLEYLQAMIEYDRSAVGWDLVSSAIKGVFASDIPRLLYSWRKRLDLFGNDYYLAHIYRTMHWWTQPTHVTVLGDLLGSQWVSDEEFERRSDRFWNRVFVGGTKVEDWITDSPLEMKLPLQQTGEWQNRIINVAGNHDIGYAGDINEHRVARFEKAFGRANYAMTFEMQPSTNQTRSPFTNLGGLPSLRIVVLNSMNLDTPALDTDIQSSTYKFMNDIAIGRARDVEDQRQAVVLLTHIPLHKEEGVCVDAPFFDFSDYGIKEQNHLSIDSSRAVLEGIYGMSSDKNAPRNGLGRTGIILNGHDHEGCDTFHYIPEEEFAVKERSWKASPWFLSKKYAEAPIPGIRELTVRSMMGSFGGNAGMLSGWFDEKDGEWKFAYASCSVGVQHLWWAIHVLDIVTALVLVAGLSSWVWERRHERTQRRRESLKQFRAYRQGRDVLTKRADEMFTPNPFELAI